MAPAAKASADLLAGLAEASWLDGRREEARAAYSEMIDQDPKWVSETKIKGMESPNKENILLNGVREAVLAEKHWYRELEMIHPLGHSVFDNAVSAGKISRQDDPVGWALDRRVFARTLDEALKQETEQPLPPATMCHLAGMVFDVNRGALEVFSNGDDPTPWADVSLLLSGALDARRPLFEPEARSAMLKEAIERTKAVADSLREESHPDIELEFAIVAGNLSHYCLHANRPQEAKDYAARALQDDPAQTWIVTNLISAHLLLDEWDEAQSLLIATGDDLTEATSRKRIWETLLEDLASLEATGIKHPNLKRMRSHIDANYRNAADLDEEN